MTTKLNPLTALTCDVLVIGSGAGGLSTAIMAKKHGLDVVVIEKEAYFGGTTAFSGGVLWIPGNAQRDAERRRTCHRASAHAIRASTRPVAISESSLSPARC